MDIGDIRKVAFEAHQRGLARQARISACLLKGAKDISQELPGVEVEEINEALLKIYFEFSGRLALVRSVGTSPDAKKQLVNLAQKAEALLEACEMLGEGATEIMLLIDTPHKRAQRVKEEIFGRDPKDPLEQRWLEGINGLAQDARAAVAYLEDMTSKGGRNPLGARLLGSPEKRLAQVCMDYLKGHGCHSQAVVLKMVQVVLEAEHGKDAMRRIDGKPSRDKGRKAVRKAAQTSPKNGSV